MMNQPNRFTFKGGQVKWSFEQTWNDLLYVGRLYGYNQRAYKFGQVR